MDLKERMKYETPENKSQYVWGTRGGWRKPLEEPVISGEYGTCFDLSVLKRDGLYQMWLSWRPKASVAYSESRDGVKWSAPVVVLPPVKESDWQSDEVSRPSVIYQGGVYKMWYSGQVRPYVDGGTSAIGYAESMDGIHWDKRRPSPVLSSTELWEKTSLMCPHVTYDKDVNIFRMWYSGGGQHEPDAIGYAESPDGIRWEKYAGNPIFMPDPGCAWERHKIAACQVIKSGEWYYMLYIGYQHEERGSIGIARSANGTDGWTRSANNPIIAPTKGGWDEKSVYKPFAIKDKGGWKLWYNGARYDSQIQEHFVLEQIGLAECGREDLGFEGGNE